jgi:transcriptional antiterminator Rof (Rho-off)
MEELATHLTDDSVAVLEAVGSEKFRYLNGYAMAINSKGETVSLNLDKIYELASEKFGVKEISKAMY